MHDQIKAATGIKCANCETCSHLGSDNDGGEPECSKSWPVCNRFDRYQYLRSFPFKKEMPCWEPEFWHSKFANLRTGSHRELLSRCRAFRKAVDAAVQPVSPN